MILVEVFYMLYPYHLFYLIIDLGYGASIPRVLRMLPGMPGTISGALIVLSERNSPTEPVTASITALHVTPARHFKCSSCGSSAQQQPLPPPIVSHPPVGLTRLHHQPLRQHVLLEPQGEEPDPAGAARPVRGSQAQRALRRAGQQHLPPPPEQLLPLLVRHVRRQPRRRSVRLRAAPAAEQLRRPRGRWGPLRSPERRRGRVLARAGKHRPGPQRTLLGIPAAAGRRVRTLF